MKLLSSFNPVRTPWAPGAIVTTLWRRAAMAIRLFVLFFVAIAIAPVAQAHNTSTKTTSTPSVAIGGTATYTIRATADGTTTSVVGSQLTDILPLGFTYLSTTSVTLLNTNATRTAVVDPVVGTRTPTWGTFTNVLAGGAIAAGAEQIVFNATVGPTAACGANTNNVLQTAGNVHTNTNALNTASINVTGNGMANLVVTKVTTTPNVARGGTAGYTITVTNTAAVGSCPATGVTITDTLPAGFTYAATGAIALNGGTVRTTNVVIGASTFTVTPVTTTPAPGAIAPVWGNFVIPAGGSITLPFTATVGAAQAAGTYSNSASTGTTAAGATVTNFNGGTNTVDDVTVFVPTLPILTKAFNVPTVVVGQTAQIIFKVDNSATTTINRTAVTFRDTLTTGLTIANPPAPTSAGCLTAPTFTAANGTTGFRATNFSIAAGATCFITLTVNVGTAGTRSNTTGNMNNLTANLSNGVTLQNLSVTNPVAPTIAKSFAPNPVAATVPTVLTLTLNNPNPVTIDAVTFIDTFPTTPAPGMTVASPLVTTNTCGGALVNNLNATLVAGNLGIRLNNGTMLANSSCTISVKVVATAVGNYVNTTGAVATINNTVTSTGLTATSTLSVLASVPPFIAKVFSPATVGAGDVSTLTFTVTNANSAVVGTIAGVAFSDTYPSGLVNAPAPNVVSTCTGGTITGGAAGGNTIALSGASIPSNSSCTVSVNVMSATAGIYVNTSGAVSSTTTTPFVIGTGNTASSTLSVLPKPTISKAFATPNIAISGTTTLTLTVTNPSTALALSNAAFTDTFPANLLVATPNALTNNCGGTVTAAAATGVLSMSGGTLAVNSSCTISVDVTSSVVGSYSNTAGGVSSAQTGTAGAVSNTAVLTVLATPTISKAFSPAAIPTDGASTLTLTISNPNGIGLSGLALTDNFPANLVVAANPNISGTCGGIFSPSPADASITLAGGTVAANASCTLSVDVTSSLAGAYSNTSGGVASTQTGAAGAVSNTAVLNVVNPPAIAKSFSPISVPAGSPSTLTLVISNTNAIALTGLAFTDTFPNNLVVAATPNMVSSCGGTFAPVAGAIDVGLVGGTMGPNTTCTVSVAVTSTIAGSYDNYSDGVSSIESGAAGALSNTATLTVTALGVPINGFVYNDANHNIQKDAAEAGTPLTLFAKLVPLAGGPALQTVPVTAGTGAYQFPAVTAGQYSIVIDDNATLADVTPAAPAGWLGTEMAGFTRSNVLVGTVELHNLNFGLFNGSKLSGSVFADTGIVSGVSNNGIRDGGELGIPGVTVKANTGATTYDSAITDGAGNYTLWIPAVATSPVLISETNLSGYLSTGGSAGNTNGTYTRTSDSTGFTFTAGVNYANVNFGDVPVNRFVANGQQAGMPGNVLFYPHQFDAGSGGTVVFGVVSANSWPTIIYRDSNCNGVIDATETVLSSAAVVANERICVISKVTIPTGTALGLQDAATLQAVFTYTNANPALAATLLVIDSTTVGAGSAGLALTKIADKATALPGDTIIYTVTYQNNGGSPLGTIVISDATPAFTTFLSAGCTLPLPAALTACSVSTQPAVGGQGGLQWTLTGSLSPAATGQVVFAVKVN
jgi:uncharacterized repeat protein (TIGR01451 family)/fimbrial isopeptide formation D2 family protein